ncbi:MAG: hypothetical protein NTV57_18595 [Cyanobacteria bacterium]|nr:hypothetical protein [Cyanobacteriota bacterium]
MSLWQGGCDVKSVATTIPWLRRPGVILLDTHALIWSANDDRLRLSTFLPSPSRPRFYGATDQDPADVELQQS